MSDTNTAPAPAATEETVVELTPIQKCEAMHAKGMGEDDIIGALAQHDGMSIMKAVGVYKKFQKSAGLILSKEDRVARIEELITLAVTATMEVIPAEGRKKEKTIEVKHVDIAAASKSLMDELGITGGAAKGHIRRYCKANDIEMPTRTQLATDALVQYKDAVLSGIKAGKSKADIAAYLVAEKAFPDVTEEKAAKRIYSRIAKAAGLQASRGSSDYSAVIAFLKEKGQDFATKDGLANALVAELEMTFSAAKGIWKLYTFAKQFAAEPVVEETAAE